MATPWQQNPQPDNLLSAIMPSTGAMGNIRGTTEVDSGVFNCQLQKSLSSALTSLQSISLFGKYQSEQKALLIGIPDSCESHSRWRFRYLYNIRDVSPDVSVQK